MLAPYHHGTLRTRTMSLPDHDPCQAEQNKTTCFPVGRTRSVVKAGSTMCSNRRLPELSEHSSSPRPVALRGGRMKNQGHNKQEYISLE